MATVEQLAQALAEVRQQFGEAQRLASEAQRAAVPTTTPGGQVDPRVMNKCPSFSGRDTEWSEWSFIFESVAAMASLESAMEGAFTGLAEVSLADLIFEMKLSAKQLYNLLVNTVRGKSADSRPKRRETSRPRSMETHQDRVPARRSWTAHSNAHGNHATWWDSRGAANTFWTNLLSGNDESKSTKVKVLGPSQTT